MNALGNASAEAPDGAFLARPVPPALAEAYFAKVQSYEADRLRASRRSQRLAWTVAGIASCVAACACLAVAALTPLKTVVPMVFRVDAATGVVDALSELTGGPQSPSEAVARYFLAKYIRAREGFVWEEAEANFHAVSLMSARPEQARYAAWFRGSNPDSPQVTIGRRGSVRVQIVSISVLGPKLAQVRFQRIEDRSDRKTATRWVATLAFDWSQAAVGNQDRLVNPLGFLVTEYHADPEAT